MTTRIVIVRLRLSKQAEDAVYLDTTGLNIQEVVEKIKAEAEKNVKRKKPID